MRDKKLNYCNCMKILLFIVVFCRFSAELLKKKLHVWNRTSREEGVLTFDMSLVGAWMLFLVISFAGPKPLALECKNERHVEHETWKAYWARITKNCSVLDLTTTGSTLSWQQGGCTTK